jgi:D-alanyl-D-alanine carboxypeptidase
MSKLWVVTAIAAIFVLAPSVADADLASAERGPQAAEQRQLARSLEEVVRTHPTFPGAALTVRAPTLFWSGAAGVHRRGSRTPLAPDATFRIASLTKTFTAAAILRLVEEGRLALDDPIARHLGPSSVALLRAGGYDVDSIRVRHLLQHTSGLAGDYANLPSYLEFVVAHPRHRWTRTEQVRFVTTRTRPLARPGKEYHYSDTGYILLGEMLERRSGRGLGAAYRSLLRFERLGLDETYLESREPVPATAKPRAHQYLGTLDLTAYDPSFDLHGAGGHVSSLDDLTRFYRALLDGDVFEKPATLRTMLGKPNPASLREVPMGIVPAPFGRETCFGHFGFWGVAVYHCPRSDVTIASSITQADGFITPTQRLLARVYRLASGRTGG